ncbi:MAG: hypothetical protein RL151_635, partial [Bacteroidota bacterium]
MSNRVVYSHLFDLLSRGRTALTLRLFCWFLIGMPIYARSQAPTVSYTSPQAYHTGTAISTLSPTSSNVPALTYGNVTTYAGSGTSGGADNANPLSATFQSIKAITRDARGNMYVAEHDGKRIRKIAPNGTVTTLKQWVSFMPNNIEINSATGDLYISIASHRILKVPNSNAANYPAQDPTYPDWTDATIVWLGSSSSGNGDGIGTSARFDVPLGLDVDASNTYLYIADYNNNRIRRVTIASGQVTTVTTNGSTAVGITYPEAVVLDATGNLYVTSSNTRRVHKITGAVNSASISDFAGSGSAGYLDGQGTTARFNEPR